MSTWVFVADRDYLCSNTSTTKCHAHCLENLFHRTGLSTRSQESNGSSSLVETCVCDKIFIPIICFIVVFTDS